MSTLIFDIETVGVNFDTLDEKTKENLTAWIKRESEDEADYEKSLEEISKKHSELKKAIADLQSSCLIIKNGSSALHNLSSS